MIHATVDVPEEVLASLRQDAEGFARELKLAAAVKWYEMRRISQERAALIAGLSRQEFIFALARYGVTPFQYTAEEAIAEAGRE